MPKAMFMDDLCPSTAFVPWTASALWRTPEDPTVTLDNAAMEDTVQDAAVEDAAVEDDAVEDARRSLRREAGSELCWF